MVVLVWKAIYLKGTHDFDIETPLFLIASNYYNFEIDCLDGRINFWLKHKEEKEDKVNWIKTIEPFTIEQLPLLIGTKTTTLHARLLKGEITKEDLKKNGYIFYPRETMKIE